MNMMIVNPIWPALEAGSQAERYAGALNARLKELRFDSVTAATEAPLHLRLHPPGYSVPEQPTPDDRNGRFVDAVPCLVPGTATATPDMVPFVFDDEDFFRNMPAPLACHEVREDHVFVAFASGRTNEAQHFADIKHHLERLAPKPVRFAVIGPAAHCTPQNEEAYRHADIAWIPSRGEAYARTLQGADAVLLDPAASGQDLYATLLCDVPLVAALAGATDYPGAGIGTIDASPEELAGLLLLLATDPPIRRRTLDGQRSLRQAHSPAQQRAALVCWLASLGITAMPESAQEPIPEPLHRVEGVFDSSYSLAIVNRHLAMALEDAGQRVALHTYEQGPAPSLRFDTVEQPRRIQDMWERSHAPQPPAVSLRNAWPPVVRDMRGERRVLASYAWEETAFPEAMVEEFNQTLDLITVVSSQTAKVLRDAGVRTPIAVVGNGVDHLLDANFAPLPRPLPGGFRFLHVSSCFPRKGVDVMLQAYGMAFRESDDVVLVIKTFPNPHNDVAQQLAQQRARDPGYPRVELIEEDWSPDQIVGLYRACNALVAPSRGEGFGLPVAEAMLHGLPVITTAWGGQLDFCSEETVWLVDYNPEPAQTHINLPNSLWAEPSVDSLKNRLRELHALPAAQLARKTTQARTQILARYTWRQVAQRTLDAIAAVNTQPAPLPQPKIGWISTWGSRCGIAAYSSHLSKAFSAERLYIYAPSNETVEMADGSNVSRNWALGTGQLTQLCEQAIGHGLDAIVVQFNWGFMSVEALCELVTRMSEDGIGVYVFFHNTSSGVAAKLAEVRPVLTRCKRLLVHSVGDVQRLKKFGYEDNVTLFPLGVYPVALPSGPALAARRQSLRLTGKRVLATYGFLMPHKGLSVLIEAVPRLIAAQPDLHLLMVNAFYSKQASGAELKRLEQRIAELGLKDRVTLQTEFLEEEESLALLALADLIVFPYQNTEESSSAAVRMALLAERPVAVTPLAIFGDVASAVAWLPGVDSDALASGINELLRQLQSKDTAQDYVGKARTYVDRHNSRRLSRRLHHLIEGCFLQEKFPV
jgi:glycosyltransferase involved in cell wall biosynthesis